MRAAYIDMTNENNTCPQGLTYTVENSICASVHIPLLNALQSPSQHMECPTLRSVIEQLHTKKVQMMHYGTIAFGANNL